MASRAIAKVISDWSKITSRVHQSELPILNKLKSQIDAFATKVASLPENLLIIDWDLYKKHASDPKIVEELQKKYSLKFETPKEPAASSETIKKSKSVNPPESRGPISWSSLLIGGSLLAGLTAYFWYLKNKRHEKIALDKARSYGKAAIGGSFELVDTEGKTRTSKEFLGRWMLIYFGFTHCPDVCPEELEKLATVVDNLVKQKVDIVPLFISVDPERDTPEMVGKYLKEFSDKFIGLTGSKEQIEKATRSYRVYYSVGPKDKDNDYIVDHTIISYLINPKGELADYFGQTKLAPEIESSILLTMKTNK